MTNWWRLGATTCSAGCGPRPKRCSKRGGSSAWRGTRPSSGCPTRSTGSDARRSGPTWRPSCPSISDGGCRWCWSSMTAPAAKRPQTRSCLRRDQGTGQEPGSPRPNLPRLPGPDRRPVLAGQALLRRLGLRRLGLCRPAPLRLPRRSGPPRRSRLARNRRLPRPLPALPRRSHQRASHRLRASQGRRRRHLAHRKQCRTHRVRPHPLIGPIGWTMTMTRTSRPLTKRRKLPGSTTRPRLASCRHFPAPKR